MSRSDVTCRGSKRCGREYGDEGAGQPGECQPYRQRVTTLAAIPSITTIEVAAIKSRGSKASISAASIGLSPQGRTGRLNLALQVVQYRRKCVEYRLWIESQPQQAHDHRGYHQPFARGQIGELPNV